MQHEHEKKKHTRACKGTLPIIMRHTIVTSPFDGAIHKFMSKIYGPQWQATPWRSETWSAGTAGQTAHKTTTAKKGTP